MKTLNKFKMKKLLTLLLFAGIYTTATSQVYVQGGLNLANITKSAGGATDDNNMLTTFNVGLLDRFNITPVLAFETGLLLDGRGSKSSLYASSDHSKNFVVNKFNPLYLEIPANLVLKVPLGAQTTNGRNVFFNFGPYAAVGIAGKNKVETNIEGNSTTRSSSIKFTNDNPLTSDGEGAAYDKLKRFDFGLNVGAGIDLGKLMIKANYGFGLAKINSLQTDNNKDAKNKYRTLSVSLGVPLSR
ncbi:MAG: outer membrane beta-barrel protein [Ginsengibacter sp.]